MKSDFIVALTQLASERNLPRDIVVSAIEDALLSAYKRDSVAANQDISVKLDPGSGQITVFILKTVAENPENNQQISLEQAKEINEEAVDMLKNWGEIEKGDESIAYERVTQMLDIQCPFKQEELVERKEFRITRPRKVINAIAKKRQWLNKEGPKGHNYKKWRKIVIIKMAVIGIIKV